MAALIRSKASPRGILPKDQEASPPQAVENTGQPVAIGYLFRLARVVGYGLLLISLIDFLVTSQ